MTQIRETRNLQLSDSKPEQNFKKPVSDFGVSYSVLVGAEAQSCLSDSWRKKKGHKHTVSLENNQNFSITRK